MSSPGFHLGPQQQRRSFWDTIMGPEIHELPTLTASKTQQIPEITAPEIQQSLTLTASQNQRSKAVNLRKGLKHTGDATADDDDNTEEAKRLKRYTQKKLRRKSQRRLIEEEMTISQQKVRYAEDEIAFLEEWRHCNGWKRIQWRELTQAFNDRFNEREPRQLIGLCAKYFRLAAKKAATAGRGPADGGGSGISQRPTTAEEKQSLATTKESNANLEQHIPINQWYLEPYANPNGQNTKTSNARTAKQMPVQTHCFTLATQPEYLPRKDTIPLPTAGKRTVVRRGQ